MDAERERAWVCVCDPQLEKTSPPFSTVLTNQNKPNSEFSTVPTAEPFQPGQNTVD
jgi:hypothetical protein